VVSRPEHHARFGRDVLFIHALIAFAGYHNNPKADAEIFAPGGWLRTGDVVVRDADGHIFVTDRLKEVCICCLFEAPLTLVQLIKYKGFQVAPAELEHLLLSRFDVADCGVVPALRPEEATEVPRAYSGSLLLPSRPSLSTGAVTLVDMAQAGPQKATEILQWAAKRTAPYKKIRGGIVFLPDIPKKCVL
jgi:4-coumarate--CoA ligase